MECTGKKTLFAKLMEVKKCACSIVDTLPFLDILQNLTEIILDEVHLMLNGTGNGSIHNYQHLYDVIM